MEPFTEGRVTLLLRLIVQLKACLTILLDFYVNKYDLAFCSAGNRNDNEVSSSTKVKH